MGRPVFHPVWVVTFIGLSPSFFFFSPFAPCCLLSPPVVFFFFLFLYALSIDLFLGQWGSAGGLFFSRCSLQPSSHLPLFLRRFSTPPVASLFWEVARQGFQALVRFFPLSKRVVPGCSTWCLRPVDILFPSEFFLKIPILFFYSTTQSPSPPKTPFFGVFAPFFLYFCPS